MYILSYQAYRMAAVKKMNKPGERQIFVLEAEAACTMIQNKLADVWESKVFSDIDVLAQGGEIRAHKLVLSAYCTNISTGDLDQKKISLNIEVHVLRMVLEYIYIRKIKIAKENLKSVGEAAKLLGVKDLHLSCTKSYLFSQNLAEDNALEVWVKALEIGEENIAVEALSFALKHFTGVQKNKSFRDLSLNYLKTYITHPDLAANSPEDCCSFVFSWLRVNPNSRSQYLLDLLEILPLADMSAGSLDVLLEDPLLQDVPSAVEVIRRAHGSYNKDNLQMGDAGSQSAMEKCLILVGTSMQGVCSSDIMAVRLQKQYAAVKLITLDTTLRPFASCCVWGHLLYCTGLGPARDQIWCYNLKDNTAEMCAKLVTPRLRHTTSVGPDGTVYILGGEHASTYTTVHTVEMYTPDSVKPGHTKPSTIKEAPAPLRYKDCWKCCSVCVQSKVILCGTKDTNGYNQILVWDPATWRLSRTLRLRDHSEHYVYGATVCGDYLVLIGVDYTAVVSIEDVLDGSMDSLRICYNYLCPNSRCGVFPSTDQESVVLICGRPGADNPDQYVYKAKLTDIINDNHAGWRPVSDTRWSLDKCELNAYDVAYIDVQKKSGYLKATIE